MPPTEIIAIMDLEFTAWEGSWKRQWRGPGEEREIVQIGALKLRNDETLPEADVLDILVKPRINPELSEYFINLTGITQVSIEAEGMVFSKALDRLVKFFGKDTKSVYSMGHDYMVIKSNCLLNDIAFPFNEKMFVNARELLARTVGKEVAALDSSELSTAMGFPAPGVSHQGISDCRCIAETLRILRRRRLF